MKAVPESHKFRGAGSKADTGQEAGSASIPVVRRRSGRLVVLGLLLGAGVIQAGIVVSLHWDEWRQPQPVMSIWTPYDPAPQSAAPGTPAIRHGHGEAFYPPPGWDDGLLSANHEVTESWSARGPEAQTSFGALMNFLHRLHFAGFDAAHHHRHGLGPELAAFQQASTSGP